MTYDDSNGWSDVLIAEMFESIPTKLNYTEEQIYLIHNTQKYVLLDPFGDPTVRKLWMSRNLQAPLREIRALTTGQPSSEIPLYRLYSEHDTQIANVVYTIYE